MRGPSALSLGLLLTLLAAASALPHSSACGSLQSLRHLVAAHRRARAEIGIHRAIEAENRRLEQRIGALAEQFRATHGLPDTSAATLLQLRQRVAVRAAPGPRSCHHSP